MATVETRALVKAHGPARVLDGVSLAVADGEFLVLVGPSGCGKSTLLRSIAGLERIESGQVLVGGQDLTLAEPRERDLAMVFQSYALYPHLTVRENLAFALKMRRMPAGEITTRIDDAAQMLDLGALLERRPAQLSGGQRQRVAMGRAVVRKPRAFLFDEPLSNLDSSLRAQMRVELKRLHQRLSATMIYVTHDQVEAMTLADRIAVLNKGRIEQVGTPDELYDRPANEFVARFLGTPEMNIIVVANAAALIPSPPAGAVRVGVRAEDVLLAADGALARVDVVERLGWESLVHLDVSGVQLIARVEGTPPAEASQVHVKLRAARLHPFNADGVRV